MNITLISSIFLLLAMIFVILAFWSLIKSISCPDKDYQYYGLLSILCCVSALAFDFTHVAIRCNYIDAVLSTLLPSGITAVVTYVILSYIFKVKSCAMTQEK